jgi:hypothetical protein
MEPCGEYSIEERFLEMSNVNIDVGIIFQNFLFVSDDYVLFFFPLMSDAEKILIKNLYFFLFLKYIFHLVYLFLSFFFKRFVFLFASPMTREM